MLNKLIGRSARRSVVVLSKHYPLSATAAVVTLAATINRTHVVQGIQWSYSEAPTGGRLTVMYGAVVKFDVDITAAGPGGFGALLPADTNELVTITLASGAGTCVGKLNVQSIPESSGSR